MKEEMPLKYGDSVVNYGQFYIYLDIITGIIDKYKIATTSVTLLDVDLSTYREYSNLKCQRHWKKFTCSNAAKSRLKSVNVE